MGQQQLLLIVLGVIIVGIAVAIGISMVGSSSVDANRDATVMQINRVAADAQMYYRKPTAMSGGGQDFNGYSLTASEYSLDIGEIRLGTSAPTASATSAPTAATANTAIGSSAQTIYVSGYGTELGDDDTNLILMYATVTPTNVAITKIN